MASSPPPPAPIRNVTTIAETIDAISTIIDWSIATASRLGYFAAMYKRITIAKWPRLPTRLRLGSWME